MKDGALLSKRAFLRGLGSLAGAAGFCAPFRRNLMFSQVSGGHGVATGVEHLRNDKNFSVHFAADCGILVPKNELKWQSLRPSVKSFNFGRSDLVRKLRSMEQDVLQWPYTRLAQGIADMQKPPLPVNSQTVKGSR
jgi:hypothetical protein